MNMLELHRYIHTTGGGGGIRVFLFGDYEFLGKSYGISGASGKLQMSIQAVNRQV